MKPKNEFSAFFNSIEQCEINLSQHQKKQLVAYYNLLVLWNSKINLVSRRDTELILEKHFSASMLYARFVTDFALLPREEIIDFGSGGGLPGVIISIVNSENPITLIDSSRKKTLFLKKAVKRLDLNAKVLNVRAQDLSEEGSRKYDFGVARGFAPLPQLITLAGPLIKKGGSVFSLKGSAFSKEFEPKEENKNKVVPMAIGEQWLKSFPGLAGKAMLRLEF